MLKIAKISTGLTVFAGAGFLVGAILTDNGSTGSMSTSDRSEVVQLVEDPSQSRISKIGNSGALDRIITSSVRKIENIRVTPLNSEQPTLEPIEGKKPKVRPRVLEVTAEETPEPKGKFVVVQPGDTLYGIGRSNGLSVSEIAEINGLSDPYRIRPGQKLIISQ